MLNSDGVEVEADYFDSLEPNTTLMVLCGEERWTAQFTGGSSDDNSADRGNEKPKEEDYNDMMKLVESIQSNKWKKKKTDSQRIRFRTSIGWMHFSAKEKRYKQVRSSKLDPKNILDTALHKDISYDEIVKMAADFFFPDGRSRKGKKSCMLFMLGKVNNVIIPKEGFSLAKYAENKMTLKLRIYLYSKVKVCFIFIYILLSI
ncbi:uncharacterized protein LOC132739013 isoform X3 [Ruditapes philippinarum]|nr:uncharacterized protein LOC132739013 isoform X3 [Ruditapes philippinarum]